MAQKKNLITKAFDSRKHPLHSKIQGAFFGMAASDSLALPFINVTNLNIDNIWQEQRVMASDGSVQGLISGELSPECMTLLNLCHDYLKRYAESKEKKSAWVILNTQKNSNILVQAIPVILLNSRRISRLEDEIRKNFAKENPDLMSSLRAVSLIMIKCMNSVLNPETIFEEIQDYIQNPRLLEIFSLVKNLYSNNTHPDKALGKIREQGADDPGTVVAAGFYSFIFSMDNYDNVMSNAIRNVGADNGIAVLAGTFFGAFHGLAAIPEGYVKSLKGYKEIHSLTKKLCQRVLKGDL